MEFTYFSYFFLLCFTFLFSLLGSKKNYIKLKSLNYDKYKVEKFHWNINYLIAFILLVIIASIRQGVGEDFYGYQELYQNFTKYSVFYSLYRFEPGFLLITNILSSFYLNYNYFLFIYAFFTWFFFFISFRNNYKILPYCLLFLILNGFYFWTFNGVRQATAITIFAFAVNYILSKDLKKFLLIILLGGLFHYSIFLLIPLYFIIDKNFLEKIFKRIPLLLFYFLTIYLNSLDLLRYLANYVIDIIPKYAAHTENMYTLTIEKNTGLGEIYNHIINIFIIIISTVIIERFPKSKIYFYLTFIGMLLANMIMGIQIFGRLVLYFIFFKYYVLGFISYYLIKKSTKENHAIFLVVILSFIILFIAEIHYGNPYMTIFQNPL